MNALVAANIPVVTSANNQNDGGCTTSPARMGYGGSYATTHRTITVGATGFDPVTYNDHRWSVNASSGSNHGTCVSIYAPGQNVRIALSTGASNYLVNSGTSYSSAITTGVVARLLQRYPTLTPLQVWNELVNRANNHHQYFDYDPAAGIVNNKLVYISHAE